MKPRNFRQMATIFGAAALFAVATTEASAHAELVSAEPAADATVATPDKIVLHFGEELEMALSSMDITDNQGHAVATTHADAPDDKSLAVTPSAPLAPGLYTVSWTVVGDDSHQVKGNISFTVQ